MKTTKLIWDQWKKEIVRLSRKIGYSSESIKEFDWTAWREFFDNDYTPDDAVYEENQD